jgi:AcrR family transcriptional regulator
MHILDNGGAATEQRGDRRAALVAAAYQRIASGGFEGLRTRDVAADAGVNIATLHYYFPTKEALIRGVIGHAMRRFIATLPGEGSPLHQLRGHLRGLARLLKEDQDLWAVMGELILRAPRDPDLAHVFRQTDEFWHRSLRVLISACTAEGALDTSLDADDLATLLIVSIKGLSLPTVAGFDARRADQVFRQFERLLGLPAGDLVGDMS